MHDLKKGDIIALCHKEDSLIHASHFEVIGFDGEHGVKVNCLNGSWIGIYDVEMEILQIITPPGFKDNFLCGWVMSRS